MATFTSSTFLGGAGRFKMSNSTSWASVRGAASCNEDFATYEVASRYSAPTWSCQRVFLPIDTSSIPDGATIDSVTLNFNAKYEGGLSSTEIHLIQTTQATTGSRDQADYDLVSFVSGGSTTVPDSGATANSITGNATSLGWIVDNGNTLIAVITTGDLNNVDPNGGTEHWCTITSPELVVEYTVAGGTASRMTLLGVGR